MKLLDALILAQELRAKHKLVGWRFRFDKAKQRFGSCNHSLKLITLSESLTELNDEKEVKNVILHEIAHALVERHNGHNHIWKAKAISIGCSGDRCYDSKVVTAIKKPYCGVCPKCNRKCFQYRRTNVACGYCCKAFNNGKFSSDYKLVWSKV